MIKSKISILTWPIVCVVIMLIVQMVYTIFNVIITNLSVLTNLIVIGQLVVLTLVVFFLFVMLERHTRIFILHEHSLEIKYFLGLRSINYEFKDLRFTYYSWTKKVALLELPSGRQLTLGKGQYLNFDQIVDLLQVKIQHEKLRFKFVNVLTVSFIVVLMLLLVMVFLLGQG